MGRQGINPRFPHWVKIERTVADITVNPPTSTTQKILESECRNFTSRSGGTGMIEQVIVSDYTIAMPFSEIEIQAGDILTITDRVKTFTGIVVNSYNGNLGCMIWHNKTNN